MEVRAACLPFQLGRARGGVRQNENGDAPVIDGAHAFLGGRANRDAFVVWPDVEHAIVTGDTIDSKNEVVRVDEVILSRLPVNVIERRDGAHDESAGPYRLHGFADHNSEARLRVETRREIRKRREPLAVARHLKAVGRQLGRGVHGYKTQHMIL